MVVSLKKICAMVLGFWLAVGLVGCGPDMAALEAYAKSGFTGPGAPIDVPTGPAAAHDTPAGPTPPALPTDGGGGSTPTPVPVDPPPPAPSGAVWFTDAWQTSVDEFSVEFGGRLETDNPTLEELSGGFSITSISPSPRGWGGSLGFVRSSGFSYYRRVTGLEPDTEYVVEVAVETAFGTVRHSAPVRTLPKLETRLAFLRDGSEQVGAILKELERQMKSAGAADAEERHNTALLVGQLDAIEQKMVDTATGGNIRGSLAEDEKLVRGLVSTFTSVTTATFAVATYIEQSEVVADLQLEKDNAGPIRAEPVKGKAGGSASASEKMISLGLAKADVGNFAKLSPGEVKLAAIKGLIVAAYAYREQLMQSLWWGSPTMADMASTERELLEAEEAIVALSRDSEVVTLLTDDYRAAIRELRFRVHDTREAIADWRLGKLAERQWRMRRVVNDLRGSYLSEWRGLSQKG